MTRLSIIVPTIGRLTLGATVRSLVEQPLQEGDEIIVVGGCARPLARFANHPVRHLASPVGKNWGCLERTTGIGAASGTHLAFIDDDDIWLPGARAAIDEALREHSEQPLLFRMRYRRTGRELWSEPVLRMGNVSTQMMVLPNDPSKLGRWGARYEGDYDFLASMRWPVESIIWRDRVIAQLGD